jgi:hypothetical protein
MDVRDKLWHTLASVRARLMPGGEALRATSYWAGLAEYHLTNDADDTALARSRWLADVVIPPLDIESLLEIGTNSGRNLQIIRQSHPTMRLCGIDVNDRAIAYARSKGLDVEFRVTDANRWEQQPLSFDAILTMSVLDHIPDRAVAILAANMVATARRHIIAVELWDGGQGVRGPYKYSRNTEQLFASLGVRTLHWDESPGQYDLAKSKLWAFVGDCSAVTIEKVGYDVGAGRPVLRGAENERAAP